MSVKTRPHGSGDQASALRAISRYEDDLLMMRSYLRESLRRRRIGRRHDVPDNGQGIPACQRLPHSVQRRQSSQMPRPRSGTLAIQESRIAPTKDAGHSQTA